MPHDWLLGRPTRSLGLLALVLAFTVSRPSAAQTVTPSFADLVRYLPAPPDATFATGGVCSTPPNPPAGLALGEVEQVESEASVVSLSALSSRVKPGDM